MKSETGSWCIMHLSAAIPEGWGRSWGTPKQILTDVYKYPLPKTKIFKPKSHYVPPLRWRSVLYQIKKCIPMREIDKISFGRESYSTLFWHIMKFSLPFTAVIILAWTPKICLEWLLCCNQSQARPSHYRNHGQRTVSYLSQNKLFSFCLNIQSFCK